MKRLLWIGFFALSAVASELPKAPQILASVRAQLPPYPVVMSGSLKKKAANGFTQKSLAVDIELHWGAHPPRATYRIRETDSGRIQELDIRWNAGKTETTFLENGVRATYRPHEEIADCGITWADLSFSFLWNQRAQTLGVEKKFGHQRYKISVPRPHGNALILWVETDTGRMMRAEEIDARGQRQKIIKVVSVKNINDLWIVKDLDIIRPAKKGRTTLRVDRVEAPQPDSTESVARDPA